MAKIEKIAKRDGRIVDFDQSKITAAIFGAAQAVGGRDKRIAELASDEVVRVLEERYAGKVPTVEDIQDTVEKVLIELGHVRTAKAYILYRRQHEEMRKLRSTSLDVQHAVDDYIGQLDWRTRENANMEVSLGGLYTYIRESVTARYMLSRVYPMEVADAHENGDLHLHDMGSGMAGYCFDEKTKVLTKKGFKYFKNVGLDDEVATLNLETENIEYQHPVDKQVFDWNSKLLYWKSKNIDLLVTPEHRMLVRTPTHRSPLDNFRQSDGRYSCPVPACGRKFDSKQALAVHVGKTHREKYRERKPVKSDWKFIRADELVNRKSYEFKRSANWAGKNRKFFKFEESKLKCSRCNCWIPESASRCPKCHTTSFVQIDASLNIPTEKFVQFMGWYLAEGNVDHSKGGYRISISCLKPKNRRRIVKIIEGIGLNPVTTEYHVTTYSKALYRYLKKFGTSKMKFIPSEIKGLPPKQMGKFLVELFRGDGQIRGGTLIRYYTSSKKMAEDVVECLIKTGKSGTIRERETETEYTITVSNKQLTPESRGGRWGGKAPRKIKYQGKVYDLTVPNGTLLVERNGNVVWSGNCAGWSLQNLLAEGFGGIPGKVSSKPPVHLDTALLQMTNFLGTLQNEWAGAQAFNSLDTLLAPFVRRDKLDYRKVKQAVQKFVFNLNIASRWGSQTPFTNVTFDLTVPEDLAGQPAVVGGKPGDRTYGEFTAEAELLNRAFIEVLEGGDMNGRVFTFPIPTYSLTPDFDWDSDLSSALFKMTAKFGLPYFQNFVNSDLKPSDVRSMCCRLRLDLRELRKNVTGGLFGSGDATGSLGVVTVNMPRIGHLTKNEDEFFERLEYIMELAKRSLELKRELVERNVKNGLLPFTKRYLGTLKNHFSTIGLVGMNEALLNLFGHGIATEDGRKFAVRTLRFMLGRIEHFQRETGNLYNLEATPAEGTSYRLAKIDKRKYPDIITAGERAPFYTNSTQLPVDNDLGMIEALRHQEELQTLYTGGTIMHIFLGEEYPSAEGCKVLFKRLVSMSKLPYFTLTPTFSICVDHGYISGAHPKCPYCGRPAEVYSRVVGYYRPVRNWNIGKREEFSKRKTYEKSLLIPSATSGPRPSSHRAARGRE